MSNAQWRVIALTLTDSKVQPPVQLQKVVAKTLDEVIACAQAAGKADLVALATECKTVHDVIPAGYPNCTTRKQHIDYVTYAWNTSVGRLPPISDEDWGRIRQALDHTDLP